MALDHRILMDWLEINDPRIEDLRKWIKASFGDPKKMRPIIDRQCENREQTRCYSCDIESGCLILNGIVYLDLGEIETAINELERANQHFRSEDKTLNHIIGLALLGSAYEKIKKDHQALRELEKAYHVLTKNYLRIHANDYPKEGRLLEIELRDELKRLSSQSFSAEAHAQTDSAHANSNPSGDDDRDYLALFSIPTYGTVEAGPDGILHIDHFDTFTIVNQVKLQGQAFDVHSVHGTTSGDRQITVMNERTHGWMRVHGLSMNGWDMPFDENDHVLFYRASIASHLDYVIASSRDPSGEMALIVKRFDEKNNQLLSKSKNTSNPYNPIPLDEDHQIVGVVIAVAKPAQ